MKNQNSEIGNKLVVEPAHTPTPWEFNELGGSIEAIDFDGERIRVLLFPGLISEIERIDAKFVINAVNSHDALITAARKFGALTFPTIKDVLEFEEAIRKAEGE